MDDSGCPNGFHPVIRKIPVETVCESDAPKVKIIKTERKILYDFMFIKAGDPCTQTRNFNSMSPNDITTLAKLCGFEWNTIQSRAKIPSLNVGADLGGKMRPFID